MLFCDLADLSLFVFMSFYHVCLSWIEIKTEISAFRDTQFFQNSDSVFNMSS